MNTSLLREFLGEDGLVEDHEEFYCYFDGFLYWQFLGGPESDLILYGNTENTITAFPVVEMVIPQHCKMQRDCLTGDEPRHECLIFWHPGKDCGSAKQALCVLTKTPEGRLSLAPYVAAWEEEK